jgi:hypothetical protein
MQAITQTYKKITKIKEAKWGTQKHIQKKILYIDPISCRIDILPAAVPVIAGI